jgi:hypothetical protein
VNNARKIALKRARLSPNKIGIARSGATIVIANAQANRGMSAKLPSSAAAQYAIKRFPFWCRHTLDAVEAFKATILEAAWSNNHPERIARFEENLEWRPAVNALVVLKDTIAEAGKPQITITKGPRTET